ncbi:glycosyltransferase [Silvibacterium dinghuense]|uniref:Glycosyltransferase n=1 Tax=Silvibacterium dinghuense TaxID=1560006 RepID=A0A4V1NVQ7_9BACT|nr:glycosyltransferase [Silvibacterium dinghuense]RXS96762.1 glycosyltransferase [Silvibacterium dinghuense]GGG93420.1 hypothetical protein GCM10011586_05230 [Silvibacterium dinghuense]
MTGESGNDTANYTMVLPVRHFRIDEGTVAVESAFAEHLRMMRTRIGAGARQLVVASPGMSRAAYEAGKQGFAVIDERAEQVAFCMLFADEAALSTAGKLRLLRPVMKTLSGLVKQSICIHSGLSWDVWLPFEFVSIVLGVMAKRRTVFVVDIDYRNSAWMSYRTGDWSLRSYLLCKYVYDVARSLQVWIAARYCSLVLLKGKKMVADFGAGRPNVKAILDASHSERNIIDRESVERKLEELRDPARPLKLIYFGRLIAYKGIDRCLRAVAAARNAGANITLDIIGGGPQADELQALARELHAEGFVAFHGAMQFGQEFFRVLYPFHLLLAAPLREDTPRSALDAMAAGIPYLAFDTYYYRELLESGGGRVVPWPDTDAMARMLIHLASNREEVAQMVEAAIVFAQANTQEIWLERRMEWTLSSVLQNDTVTVG